MGWTDNDFREVFGFFQSIRAALKDTEVLIECLEVLKSEAESASAAFGRIFDATH